MVKTVIWLVIIILLIWGGWTAYNFFTTPRSTGSGGTATVGGEVGQFLDSATGKTQLNKMDQVREDTQLINLQKTIHDGIVMYQMDKGTTPKSLEELVQFEYISQSVLTDNWGHRLESQMLDRKMIIFSSGPDGQKGSEDDIKLEIPF